MQEEILIKIDRVMPLSFSIVYDNKKYIESLKEEGIKCADCGSSVDTFIKIVKINKEEKYICSDCYNKDKYARVTLRVKDLTPEELQLVKDAHANTNGPILSLQDLVKFTTNYRCDKAICSGNSEDIKKYLSSYWKEYSLKPAYIDKEGFINILQEESFHKLGVTCEFIEEE